MNDKAIRSAKLTAAGVLDKARARTAVTRAGGQIAPSKYLPDVPRQVHADGGKVDFTRDNPGGDWLERKQARAAEEPNRKFMTGSITGVIGGRSDMFLPTHILKMIGGLNDEVRTSGVHKYDSLLSDAQKGGFDPDQKGNKVVVAVNHYGQPYLLEGNTRVAVAHSLGIPKVKAEVRYWNGAENVDGPMHPDQVFGMASNDPDMTRAEGGRVLPKGYSLKVDPDRLGVLARFKGRNVGQLTLNRDRETGKLSAFQMAVHPDHQRKGLMSAMHDAAEDAFGPMEPDKTLTDDGFAFWKGYRPDAVSNNLRFHTDKLMGQTVKTPYGPGTVNSVGRTGMNATLESGNTGWAQAADNEDVLRNVGIDPSTLKYAKGGAVDFLRGNHPLVPDVLYHGTARDVRSFDPQAKRSYDVDPSNPEDTDTGWFGKGHYFTAKPSVASHYAKEGAKRQGDQGANIIPAHVSLKNPFIVDMKAYDSGATNLDQALTRAGVPMHPRGWRKPSEQTASLMAMGHDGVIATREGQPKEYVAFRPEQIKSAISATTFDPNDPDMTRAEGGRVGKAYGGGFGYVPQAALPQLRLAVAQPLPQAQPKGGSWLNTLTDLAVAAKKPEETAAPVHGFGATMPPSSTPAPTSGAAPQTGNMSGFYAPFKSDLDRLIAEAPGAVTVTSGYRTPERQQELWDQNAAKYPDPEVRDNYVARPGHSSHNYGLAADLSFASPEVQQWVHDNAAKYNLQFRMDHEGWHVEPINVWELRDQLGPPAGYADGGVVRDDGIEAYHGSPHDFDQFDISKLGTGEGAQSYGHGLYFAGNEGVAKSYRDTLSGNNYDTGYGNIDAVLNAGKTWEGLKRSHPQLSDIFSDIEARGAHQPRGSSGHMYKVKLNVGPHELLDWDKPLSEQHPNVQAALARIDPDQWHPTGGDYDPSEQGQMAYQRLVSSGNKQGAIGEHLRAGNPMKRGDKWASEALMAQGIKGIRYRDAGSRGDTDGDPTHNYVMFHHDPVQVTQKYAYGGAAKAGGGEIYGVGNNQIGEIGNAQATTGSGQVGPQALGLLGSGGVRGGQGVLPAPSQASGEEDLIGLPKSVKMPKLGQTITAGHDPRIRQVSRDYARTSGIDYTPPTTYQKVDPARAKRIADAYEAMPHDPGHPLVKASYNALLNETKAQYDAMKRAGVNLEFYPDVNNDPYKSNPRLAVEDIRKNNHMYVYPTDAGYGTGDAMPDLGENPMLGDSGERWNGKPVMFNDLFRAVHDYFGHAKEGVGFRADGEENAWRQHAAMFSPLARIALATETRGQNSWLNYGPHGDKNRTAATEDTVFAPQKLGVLPIWAHHEGAEDFIKPQERAQMEAIYRQYSKPVNKALELTRRFTKDGAAATMALKSKGN